MKTNTLEKSYCPVVFLVGLTDEENDKRQAIIRQTIDAFNKVSMENSENVVLEVFILQYAEEGIKKAAQYELDCEVEPRQDIQLEKWGKPTAPFYALNHALQCVEDARAKYRTHGISYYKPIIICFPEYYTGENFGLDVLLKQYVLRQSTEQIYLIHVEDDVKPLWIQQKESFQPHGIKEFVSSVFAWGNNVPSACANGRDMPPEMLRMYKFLDVLECLLFYQFIEKDNDWMKAFSFDD